LQGLNPTKKLPWTKLTKCNKLSAGIKIIYIPKNN